MLKSKGNKFTNIALVLLSFIMALCVAFGVMFTITPNTAFAEDERYSYDTVDEVISLVEGKYFVNEENGYLLKPYTDDNIFISSVDGIFDDDSILVHSYDKLILSVKTCDNGYDFALKDGDSNKPYLYLKIENGEVSKVGVYDYNNDVIIDFVPANTTKTSAQLFTELASKKYSYEFEEGGDKYTFTFEENEEGTAIDINIGFDISVSSFDTVITLTDGTVFCPYYISDIDTNDIFIFGYENDEITSVSFLGFTLELEKESEHSGMYEAFMELAKDFSDCTCRRCGLPRSSELLSYEEFLQELDSIAEYSKEYFLDSFTTNKGDYDKGLYNAYSGEYEIFMRIGNDYESFKVEFAFVHVYEFYDYLPEEFGLTPEEVEELLNTPKSELTEDELEIVETFEVFDELRYHTICDSCCYVRNPKEIYDLWVENKYKDGDKTKLVYEEPTGIIKELTEENFVARLSQLWDGKSEYEVDFSETKIIFTFTDGENNKIIKASKPVEQTHIDHDGIEFQSWTQNDSLPTTAGNWYLTEDVSLTDFWTVPEGTTNLCLNGKILNLNGYRIDIPENATLNLFDCSEVEHEGNINNYHLWSLGVGEEGSTPQKIKGGIIYIPGDTTNFRIYGTFNMFGGTITGHNGSTGMISLLFNNSLHDSDLKPLSRAGNFNMYGGAITGNVYASNMYWYNKNMNFGFIDPDKFESFIVGKDAVINGNYILGPEVGGYKVEAGNVIVSGSSIIKLGTGDYAPTSNMKIGIRTTTVPTSTNPVVFTDKNAQAYLSNFESNMTDMHIEARNKNALYLCPTDVVEYVPHDCVDNKVKVNGQSATCTEDGWEDYHKCTVCETLYSDETMETEIEDLSVWKVDNGKITKLGHNYGEVSYTWDGDTCTATRVCTHDSTHIETEEVTVTKNVTQARTCEDDELTTFTATFTNTAFTTQTKENVKTAEKLGHDYGSTTYEWSADHTSCTATKVCANDNTHKLTETKQATYVKDADATCVTTEKGHYEVFFNDNQFGSTSTTANSHEVEDSAINHDYGTPTYSWSEDHTTCTAKMVCSHDSSHVISEVATLDPDDDVMIVQHQGCTLDELTKYTARFTNTAFETQNVTVKTADKRGHGYGTPTYEWSADHTTCTATRECTHNPKHVETETATATSTIVQNKTCENDELTTYTATFENTAFTTQTKTVKTADKLVHYYGTATYEWNGDTCTATRTCSHDASHKLTETKKGTYFKDTNATCTTNEKGHYEVEFNDTQFGSTATTANSKEVENTAINHNYGTATYEWNGDTCTATRTCANDPSHTLTETKKGTYVKDTNETCTTNEKGHYEVTFNDTQFGSASTSQNSREVPNTSKGHDWDEEFTVDIESTLEEEGSKSIHCKNCDEVKDITVIEKKVPSKKTTDGEKVVVEIETEGGFNTNVELVVEVVVKATVQAQEKELLVDYSNILKKNEKLLQVYDVKLYMDGVEVQPSDIKDGMVITVKIELPENLAKKFKVLHVHNSKDITELKLGDKADIGTYIIDENGYLVTKIDKLSEFAFANVKNNFPWWLIILIIVLVSGSTAYYFYRKNKQTKK